jgi:hypothetical protein
VAGRHTPQEPAEFFSAWRTTESNYAERAAEEQLRRVPWAKALLDNLEQARETGDRRQQRAFLFEVRIAFSIDRLGYQALYEYKAGVGKKSIDFRVMSKPEMLIEAMTIQNSQASERAGWVKEYERAAPMYGINFTSASPDQRQTTGGEMVHVVELLTGKASKFPSPRPGVYHLILADIRGYCAGLVDLDDCRQIAWGPRAVREQANVQFFETSPVRGVFDSDNTAPNPVRAQQRIHAVGLFSGQRNGSTDVLCTRGSIYHANPLLITTEHEASHIAGLLDDGVSTSK